eukprot:287885-Lingulodinium_polyedra.AAC.1
MVIEAGLPVVTELQLTAATDPAAVHLTGKSRAKTLRQRARVWQRVRAWMLANTRSPWPTPQAM